MCPHKAFFYQTIIPEKLGKVKYYLEENFIPQLSDSLAKRLWRIALAKPPENYWLILQHSLLPLQPPLLGMHPYGTL